MIIVCFSFGILEFVGLECDDLKRKDFRNISQVLLCTFLIYCFICILKFICFFCNTFLQEEACKEEGEDNVYEQTMQNHFTICPLHPDLPPSFFLVWLRSGGAFPKFKTVCICK